MCLLIQKGLVRNLLKFNINCLFIFHINSLLILPEICIICNEWIWSNQYTYNKKLNSWNSIATTFEITLFHIIVAYIYNDNVQYYGYVFYIEIPMLGLKINVCIQMIIYTSITLTIFVLNVSANFNRTDTQLIHLPFIHNYEWSSYLLLLILHSKPCLFSLIRLICLQGWKE